MGDRLTMLTSSTLSSLAPALAIAQGELEDASKSSVNPAFHSKYADLAEVLQTLRPVLSKNGLSLVQTVGYYDPAAKTLAVTTMLLHKSGEFIQDTCTMLVSKADAHGLGSAATYGRRYGAAAICGISQDDDDGNTAAGRSGAANDNQGAPAEPKRRGKPVPEPDPAAVDALIQAAEACTTEDELQKLAPKYAKLAATDQTKVLPAIKAAKARLAGKAAA